MEDEKKGKKTLILTDEMVVEGADEPKAPQEGGMEAKARSEADRVVKEETEVATTVKMLEKSHKKGLIIALILTLVLAAGAVLAWYFIAGLGKGETEEKKEPVVGAGADDKADEKPGEDDNKGEVDEPTRDGRIKISVNDAEARKVYGYFQRLSPYDQTWDFYVDESVLAGNVSRDVMKLVAFDNLEWEDCAGHYEYTDNIGTWELNECVPGEAMKAKIAEIFGQELTFREGETIQEVDSCGYFAYNAAYNEFHTTSKGCGGFAFEALERLLYKVERDDDKLYLYEKVLVAIGDGSLGEGRTSIYTVGKSSIRGGELVMQYDDVDYEKKREEIDEVLEQQGTEFKWTFKKTDNGGYVFEKLERLN